MFASVAVNLPFDAIYTYSVPERLEPYVFFGIRVVVPVSRREMTGFVIEIHEEEPNGDYDIKEIKRVIDKEPIFNKELLDLAVWMKRMYFSSIGENLSMMIPSGRKESEFASMFSAVSFSRIENLTKDQSMALEKLRERSDGTFYLYGVTGSGKSEVYLRRAEDFIAQGKQVLYLVPEITLTHQLSADVSSRFSGRVAILHSALTPSQRLKAWHQIASGEASLVIGARSSIFAPFKDLALIVIDEEHDTSYKSGNSPRYHARQIAQYRAKKSNAQLIMGSATPSLEAWRLILSQKMRSIVMPNRIGEGRFPKVSVVNILRERRNISEQLEREIRSALKEKKGVILFLNRRGFSYNYVCQSCGHVITCPNCSVSLTYHKRENRLICHTCGYSQDPVRVCPECGSVDLRATGFGTEYAEEEARALFPEARIARLDADIAGADKNKSKAIIDDFKDGKIDILLGTQMIAKGLNFPLVSLVGVLNADASLSIPDFRAAERTFDLIHQVSGRVGRYRDDGKVIIQTTQPLNPAIECASKNDLERFYSLELKERKMTGFPPFSRLLNLTFRGKNEEKVKKCSDQLEEIANNLSVEYEGVEVFSSSPCLIEKQAQNYRYHVLVRCAKISTLLDFGHKLIMNSKKENGVYLEIDLDPIALL